MKWWRQQCNLSNWNELPMVIALLTSRQVNYVKTWLTIWDESWQLWMHFWDDDEFIFFRSIFHFVAGENRILYLLLKIIRSMRRKQLFSSLPVTMLAFNPSVIRAAFAFSTGTFGSFSIRTTFSRRQTLQVLTGIQQLTFSSPGDNPNIDENDPSYWEQMYYAGE